MDGITRCTRYAFGPNRLHYCGPDANKEIKSYLQNDATDAGLTRLLSAFQTMYPYLQLIAASNGIADPFDDRVVRGYWLGNELLTGVTKQQLYLHLLDSLQLKKKLGLKQFERIKDAITMGAVPHHNFHVFDIWKRTGHAEQEHTLESLDSCRISWGKVISVNGPNITVKTNPLIILENKLALGKPISRTLTRQLETSYDIEQVAAGQTVSIHWGVPCEIISDTEVNSLRSLTLKHLAIANTDL